MIVDIFKRLQEIQHQAERDFSKAIELKNIHLIVSAMDRLNTIDCCLLKEKYRQAEWLRENDPHSKINKNSEENKRIEHIRQTTLAYLKALNPSIPSRQ